MRNRLASRLVTRVRSAFGTYPRGPVYLGGYTALLTTRWGGMMFVDTRDSLLTPPLLLNGLWEPEITAWLQSTLHEGQVFVDIGANVGYYSLLASRLVGPGGHVVAVEAHPRMAELLRRNVIANRASVATWHRAAWSHSEELTFHMRSQFRSNSSVGSLDAHSLVELGDTEEEVAVQGVAVDALLAGLPHVDIIKIDIEGAETRALVGLSGTLASNPGVTLLLEWCPGQMKMFDDEPDDMINFLVERGFRFQLVEREFDSVSPAELLAIEYGNVVATR